MQIKFITKYYKNENPSTAQAELLSYWQKALQDYQLRFIKKATTEFNSYLLKDYPEQEKITEAITTSTGLTGKDLDKLYEELAVECDIMELVITVDDEDYI